MSNENGVNPDQVTSDAIVQEMQRLNPTLLQLAASNIRAAQWREVALKATEQNNAEHTHTNPVVMEPAQA